MGPLELVRLSQRKRKSAYAVVKVDEAFVWLKDIAGDDLPVPSVTNDAEGVCADLALMYGDNRRFIYRDSSGHWGELVHEAGVFKDFRAAEELGL